MALRRILVVGASGRTGGQVVRQAVDRGYEVTAFVRDPARVKGLPQAVRIVKGDGLDAGAIAKAVAGHDAVVVAVGDARTFVSAPIIGNVIAGMKAAGVRRVILLSAYGAGDSGHGIQGFLFRTALRRLNADKMEAERLLAESGLEWTAVRAVTLNEKPATGRFKGAVDVVVNGFRGLSRADLAAFMLNEIEANAFVRQRPILAPA
jgi:putative NADH-flavin reductase